MPTQYQKRQTLPFGVQDPDKVVCGKSRLSLHKPLSPLGPGGPGRPGGPWTEMPVPAKKDGKESEKTEGELGLRE